MEKLFDFKVTIIIEISEHHSVNKIEPLQIGRNDSY